MRNNNPLILHNDMALFFVLTFFKKWGFYFENRKLWGGVTLANKIIMRSQEVRVSSEHPFLVAQDLKMHFGYLYTLIRFLNIPAFFQNIDSFNIMFYLT